MATLEEQRDEALAKGEIDHLIETIALGAPMPEFNPTQAETVRTWMAEFNKAPRHLLEQYVWEGNAEKCKAALDMAQQVGGDALALQLLSAYDFVGFRTAAMEGCADICTLLADTARKLGGDALVAEQFQTMDYVAFAWAAQEGETKTCETLAQMARDIGGKAMLADMLKANECRAFCSAAEGPYPETCRLLLRLAEEVGGDVPETLLSAQKFDALESAITMEDNELIGMLLSHPAAPLPMRERFAKIYAKRMGSDSDLGDWPSSRDYGAAGKRYGYGAAYMAENKLDWLSDNIVYPFDMNRLVAAQRDAKGRSFMRDDEVMWDGLADLLAPISYTKLSELGDAISEVAKYAAGYLLVANARAHGEEAKLLKLNQQELAEAMEPYQTRITQQLLESQSLPRSIKLAEQWHRYRASKIKAAQDGSTLRDRAEEGSWYPILKSGELAVSEPGLEGYSFVNLSAAEELEQEGFDLHHCASSYVDDCKQGYQVFSLRKDGVPQTTLGFELIDGNKLRFHQHTGEDNRAPNAKEKAAEKWFTEQIKNNPTLLDLSKTGERPIENPQPPIENLLGVALADLTPERLQSNLNLLTTFGKEYGQWSQKAASKRDLYLFGPENKGVSLDELARNFGFAEQPYPQRISYTQSTVPLP